MIQSDPIPLVVDLDGTILVTDTSRKACLAFYGAVREGS